MVPVLLLLACAEGDLDSGAPPPPAAEGPATPFLVVTPAALLPVAEDWAAFRADRGFAAQVLPMEELVADPGDGEALARAVVAAADAAQAQAPDATVHVLLLGDVTVEGAPGVPALTCENALGACFTDNGYADPDPDHVPRFAVGRVPAADRAEAEAALAKVEDHEDTYVTGLHNRRFFFYAGESGFDPDLASLVETLVLGGLAEVDPTYDILGLYNDPTSSFYYTPFEEMVVDLFNQGSVLAMYLGHGSSNDNDGLGAEQIEALDAQGRLPILALFACSNGAYAGPTPSVAELALARPRGPIAVLAGSDITHPYANGVYPYELQRALFSGEVDTVGEAVLEMRRQVRDNEDELRQLLLVSVTMEGVSAEEAALTLVQHQDLYNLMGDPAAGLHLPGTGLEMGFTGSTTSGGLQVQGQVPELASGRAWVTVEVPRDVMLGELQEIDPAHPDEEVVQDNWAEAVDTVVVGAEVQVEDGAFQVDLPVVEPPPGSAFYLKAYAWDEVHDAAGVKVVP